MTMSNGHGEDATPDNELAMPVLLRTAPSTEFNA